MQSIATILVSIVIAALLAGGGTYFLTSKKISQNNEALADKIDDLKNKTESLEKNTTKVAKDLNDKLDGAQTAEASQETAAPEDTTKTAEAKPAQDLAQTKTIKIDTSKWKAYSNTKYIYSVKYPADWEYKDTTATSKSAMSAISFKPKTAKDYNFDVVIEKSNLDYTIAQIKKTLGETATYKSKTTSEVGGKTFTLLNFESKAGKNPQTVYLYEDKENGLIYHFATGTNTDATVNANTGEMAKSFQITQ